MPLELADKVAIVTGASSGIGFGVAQRLVAEGAKVVIADIDDARGETAATALGENAAFKLTDVAQPDQVAALVDFTTDKFGALAHHVQQRRHLGCAQSQPPRGRLRGLPTRARYQLARRLCRHGVRSQSDGRDRRRLGDQQRIDRWRAADARAVGLQQFESGGDPLQQVGGDRARRRRRPRELRRPGQHRNRDPRQHDRRRPAPTTRSRR